MKGKTGKPSAMRGGGMARKGVGMALKGGGIARKGTGSNATPGGKVEKMAMGGKPGESAMAKAEASRSMSSSSSPRDGGFAGAGGSAGGGGGSTNRSRMSSVPMSSVPGTRSVSDPGSFPSGKGTPSSSLSKSEKNYPTVNRSLKGSLRGGMSGMSGKDQSRLASGGSVKMTAGAGSGSGRIEKVAAHKAAKRIPATGLKKGGKVKGK